ncbi:MAG: outer membrane lipoprotein-sorting protein [Candidatus Omnitrophota bacterium]|nr:outer membrane lipoprotein-sorting protein [Candidatus Omnitrophota bacterium]
MDSSGVARPNDHWSGAAKLGLILLFLLPALAFSQASLSPTEIVRRADDLLRGDTNRGTYTMEVVTPNWRRTLELYVYSLGRDKIFIRILSPAKEAGIGTLRVKNEMWNYLPNVEKTIKIPPSMMAQSWMGSDFANDDLVKESSIVNDYTHTIAAEEDTGDFSAYKIELIPKPDAAVVWGKILFWVRKGDYVPLKEEYYDEKGRLIKVLEYSDIGAVSDHIIPRVWKMSSALKDNHYTIIKVVDVEYNKPIDGNVFTLENLKKIQ